MDRALFLSRAKQFREQEHVPSTGGIVIFAPDNSIDSWRNNIRDANTQVPGCIAVDEDGNMYEAQGGDNENGASVWVVI